jgi:hypothetical protein
VRALSGALLMGALLALYLVLVAARALAFLTSGQPVGIAIGVALAVLPVLGAFALIRELRFGMQASRLLRRLAEEGGLPPDDLPRRPSGRPDRAAADARFGSFRDEALAHPDDWRAWLRLGLAYDASGDRRRARAAVRQAIGLARG